jgi:excisionase family DNA binding protein
MERYLKVKEVADLIGLSPRTIYEWAEADYIPHYRLPKGLRFKISQVDAWMQRRQVRGRVTFKLPGEEFIAV